MRSLNNLSVDIQGYHIQMKTNDQFTLNTIISHLKDQEYIRPSTLPNDFIKCWNKIGKIYQIDQIIPKQQKQIKIRYIETYDEIKVFESVNNHQNLLKSPIKGNANRNQVGSLSNISDHSCSSSGYSEIQKQLAQKSKELLQQRATRVKYTQLSRKFFIILKKHGLQPEQFRNNNFTPPDKNYPTDKIVSPPKSSLKSLVRNQNEKKKQVNQPPVQILLKTQKQQNEERNRKMNIQYNHNYKNGSKFDNLAQDDKNKLIKQLKQGTQGAKNYQCLYKQKIKSQIESASIQNAKNTGFISAFQPQLSKLNSVSSPYLLNKPTSSIYPPAKLNDAEKLMAKKHERTGNNEYGGKKY